MGKEKNQPDEDIFDLPEGMELLYMGFLRRGPAWRPEVTPEVEATQEAHLAHIGKMHAAGKLVIAGPFLDGGDLRGVFVFRTESQAEAEALSEADPAVQSGRLIIDIHPWMVQSGIIPDSLVPTSE